MNKHHRWLPVIIIIAFALRLTLLGEQSLWYDEGVTWLLSQMSPGDLIQWTAADIQPPFYYLIIWAASRLLGDSEWALRFPSVIFTMLTLPLLSSLARSLISLKRTQARRSFVPLIAAILFALSPLMVYYSQEARMYTLLVFEATLAGYLLLKILETTARPLPPTLYILLYGLIAAVALYTHYFAAFLLVAHGLYALFKLWRQGWPKPLLVQVLGMFGLTALLFIPWLPILLSRLGDDPSYWPGALKLNEALRQVIISFSVGETVFEQTARWPALGYGIIFVLGGLAWIVQKSIDRPKTAGPSPSQLSINNSQFTIDTVVFLLLWLVIPIVLILLLSYQSPKFNPRYTLLSYPAFVLLLAAALTQFLQLPPALRRTKPTLRFTFYASPLLSALSFLFIISTYTLSLYNWFADPRFSKDDFQALAQFVQERQAADETVLLSSGHMFPVWAYYYGWHNWTPLPPMARLDVTQVTGLDIAQEIAPALEGKKGVWLVMWQDEVIDPNGVVPFWLDRIGNRPVDAGDFWGVGLEHWRLDPGKVDLLRQSPLDETVTINFNNQLDLLGMHQLNDSEIALFWRPRGPLPANLLMTLDLTDEAGFDWDRGTVTGRPGAYLYPPSRWPVGEVVLTRHALPWKTGAPPGAYVVEVGLGQPAPAPQTFSGWDILDEQGRPRRRTALLAPLTLTRPIRAGFEPANPPLADLAPYGTVQQATLSPLAVEPGDRLLVALLWQAGEMNQAELAVTFEVADAAGHIHHVDGNIEFGPARPAGEVALSQHWLNLPPHTAPGAATVRLRAHNAGEHLVPLAQVDIRPTTRNFTPPANVHLPLEADFSGYATLLGADCSGWTGTACSAQPGRPITLTLYWQAGEPFDTPYTVFTHLLDPDQTVIVNADHAPAKPTQAWVIGEIIADTVTLTIPSDIPPGNYPLEVGLYDAADPVFPRLPLTNGDTQVILPPLVIE